MLQHAPREPAANDAPDAYAFGLPKKVLRCDEGFEFRQLDAYAAMLMQGSEPGPVFRCGCNSSRACGVQVDANDPRRLVATEEGCGGNWGWTLRISGLAQSFIVLATEPAADHALPTEKRAELCL